MHTQISAGKKAFLSLVALLVCWAFAGCALAENTALSLSQAVNTQPSQVTASRESLLDLYVQRLFETDLLSYAPRSAGNNLTGAPEKIYRLLVPIIGQIAAGERASTVAVFKARDVFASTTVTAQDLGVPSLVENGAFTQETINALNAMVFINMQPVADALLYDLPYEMYWFEKIMGMDTYFDWTISGDSTSITIGGTMSVNMHVAPEYQNGNSLTVSTPLAQAAVAAAGNARAVVQENANVGDLSKLQNYKNAVCSLVSYNHTAAGGSIAYGNPWQLVWVFDNDPETNVVCEGYAKAFQYLCSQTEFDGDISVRSVTGQMAVDGNGGNHMWNLIAMDDGQNYLADITNCDTDTIGYPGLLFLAVPSQGSPEDGYTFSVNGSTVAYAYDAAAYAAFPAEKLTLSAAAYSGGSTIVAVNEKNFPDAAFRAVVAQSLDSNGDGRLSETEIAAVVELDLSDMGIASLKGIEHFTSLRYLAALNNRLTEIDLSTLKALNFLYLSNNQLSSVDLTALPSLDSLWLNNNPISAIDVSQNPNLCNLKLDYTGITEIDVTANPHLLTLDVQGTGITQLDVSRNPKLVQLIAQCLSLEKIDVSKNTALTSLWVSASELTEIDLSKNTALQELFCANNHLAALDLSHNPLMNDLRGDGNYILAGSAQETYSLDALPGFDAERASNWRGAHYNAETNTLTLITENYVRYDYDCGNGFTMEFTLCFIGQRVPIDEAHFPDAAFRAYVTRQLDPDKDGALSPEEMAQVTDIDVNGMGIATLQGIEYFCNLVNLRCTDNRLTQLSLSTSSLLNLFVDNNRLETLEIGRQNTLSYLSVTSNLLSRLDLSLFPNLNVLYCDNNRLTQLDLTGRTMHTLFTGVQYPAELKMVTPGENGTYIVDLGFPDMDMARLHVPSIPCQPLSPGVLCLESQTGQLECIWDTGAENGGMRVVYTLCTLLDGNGAVLETTKGAALSTTLTPICGHNHGEFLLSTDGQATSSHTISGGSITLSLPSDTIGFQEYTLTAADAIPCRASFHVVTHPETVVSLPASLSLAADEAFAATAAEEIRVPEGVTTLGSRAFADCSRLRILVLPASLTQLPHDLLADSPHAVIRCPAGSPAAFWALENGIPCLAE